MDETLFAYTPADEPVYPPYVNLSRRENGEVLLTVRSPARMMIPEQPVPGLPNTGHGHVRPRRDGVRARCGGPGLCSECSREKALPEAATVPVLQCGDCAQIVLPEIQLKELFVAIARVLAGPAIERGLAGIPEAMMPKRVDTTHHRSINTLTGACTDCGASYEQIQDGAPCPPS
jgi:hypothetical protein